MAAETDQKFEIQKVYVKDISFETPSSPKVFTKQWNPKTDIRIHSENARLDDHVFEVCMTVQVTVTQEEATAFLVEVKQAGIFLVKNFKQEERNRLLGSHCPSILFPFARETVSELVLKGGFPQLLLNPVNFESLYQQHVIALEEQKSKPDQAKH
ncbi:MAG: protein-export chaperone SecB [Gammaproteobacteria bacterium]|nr:protein-export chaperone SecB [Gammaproteobacteria bacterium]